MAENPDATLHFSVVSLSDAAFFQGNKDALLDNSVYFGAMNTYRYDEQKRRLWVYEKHNGSKSVKQICKEAGVSRATLYNWISEFPDIAEGAPPLPPEEELVRERLASHEYEAAEKYEMLVAALTHVDKRGFLARKMAQTLVKRYTMTVPQACALVGIDEEVYGYKPRKPEVDDQLVYDELSRLIAEDRSRGFPECYRLLQQLYPDWTRKQIKRVYKIGRLYLKRTRSRRAGMVDQLVTIPAPQSLTPRLQRPGAAWNLGFVRNGEDWVLFITDDEDKTPLNAQAGTGWPGEELIIAFLTRAAAENGTPKKLRVPGKKPFDTREITRWIWENKVALHSLSLGKEENLAEVTAAEHRITRELWASGAPDEALIGQWLAAAERTD